MAKYLITLTVTVEHEGSKATADITAKAFAETLPERYSGVTSVGIKVLPATPTRAYPGEVHQDCGRMVPYGGAFLHQC